MSAPLRVSAIACTTTLLALVMAGAGSLRPGPMIERSYADAFDRLEESQSVAPSLANRFDPTHLHLSKLPAIEPAAPALAVGDRITLAARGGGAISYEVIDVRALPEALSSRDARETAAPSLSPESPRLMLITAISGTEPLAKTIRFIVDADAPAPSILPGADTPGLKPHAL